MASVCFYFQVHQPLRLKHYTVFDKSIYETLSGACMACPDKSVMFAACRVGYTSTEEVLSLEKYYTQTDQRTDLAAALMSCPVALMPLIYRLMMSEYERHVTSGYGHSEKSIMAAVFRKHPAYFTTWIGDYQCQPENYAKATMCIETTLSVTLPLSQRDPAGQHTYEQVSRLLTTAGVLFPPLKPRYRLIILIISSPGEAYEHFKETWRLYGNSNPDIRSFFVECGDDNRSDTLSFPSITDSLVPGILLKTIKAIEFVDAAYEYDYLLRTNLSSLFMFDKLLLQLDTLPKTKVYAGVSFNHYTQTFVTGAGAIISKDTIAPFIAKTGDMMRYATYPDDVVIGYAMERIGCTVTTLPRLDVFQGGLLSADVSDNINVLRTTSCAHIRGKTLRAREQDAMHIRALCCIWYAVPL